MSAPVVSIKGGGRSLEEFVTESGGEEDPLTAESLYLDLLEKCLTRSIFPERWRPLLPHHGTVRHAAYGALRWLLGKANLELMRPVEFDVGQRAEGLDRPAEAETMIGLKRLENLRRCVAEVIESKIPGDLIETGVWRGGATIFMRALLRAYGDSNRIVWVADSFMGLPKPSANTFEHDRKDALWSKPELAVSVDEVKRNFARYGLLDGQVRFLPGWFNDTLPSAPIDRLAILRLDGDMYDSTMVALTSLYSKVSPGGFVIVDDYAAIEGCHAAVHDFRAQNRISDAMEWVDSSAVFWRRGGG